MDIESGVINLLKRLILTYLHQEIQIHTLPDLNELQVTFKNTNIPKILKKDYDFKYQVCDIRLEANGIPYAIGAHIKGLGTPHEGPDIRENMLILCPNCHYLFDAFAFSIADDFH